MYNFLFDYCALILNGVTLYEGLKTNYGMVAVYGNGDNAHTLYKYGTVDSRDELELLLQKNYNVKLKTSKFSDGPIDVSVCVSRRDGIKGLERYLNNHGFKSTQNEFEMEAASEYKNKAENPRLKSKIDNEFSPDRNSWKGREIAAAVTMGYVSLSGNYGCASSETNPAKYKLLMESPLDMGTLIFKSKVVFNNITKGLVYINGKLRILTSTGKPQAPFDKPIWDIHPKFDNTNNSGLISRKVLDKFLYLYYRHYEPYVEKDKPNYALLGCYHNSKNENKA